ncbi:MAG: hypothetical protein M0Z48_00630 [Nitrospiraceae bacterium]|nr:hypothetical protein [Nitrospiraceae bacterium]
MADQYVSRINLEINGQDVDDFKKCSEGEVELAKQVKLMNKTGHCNTVPRFEVEVDYVIPSGSPEFDFTQLTAANPGTLTIDRQDGTRITYQGVVTRKIGKTEYNEEKEASKTVTLGAAGRINS